ncbi:MAG: hypothetical protein IPJ75_17725 [Ignavibacteriales bacterium]|nr:hypothetical protein [Ignavibacteriales bacterium]
MIETALRKSLSMKKPQKHDSQQIHKLIFSPGFSTSKIITDVSGRGIGMEVVQANIDKLKGKINIESATDKSTRFMIELPLSLATLRVMTASVGQTSLQFPLILSSTAIIVNVLKYSQWRDGIQSFSGTNR